jgi:hypothetical protein
MSSFFRFVNKLTIYLDGKILLAHAFFFIYYIYRYILHLWTIYFWVPGNLKDLQIFTMNNIIK